MSGGEPVRRSDAWDAELYSGSHSFVHEHGRELVDLLAPRPGERVLDVGCGTGELTAAIAERGAEVVGIDSSEAMVAAARAAHPGLELHACDITRCSPSEPFDVVFSNATLHWVRPPERALARIAAALRPGGRLVAEFGGHGNVATIKAGLLRTLTASGHPAERFQDPWFNPTSAEYERLLTDAGFLVEQISLFERPTPLDGEEGMRDWLRMFARPALPELDYEATEALFREAERELGPELRRDGAWLADYVRLRVVATRAAVSV